MHYMCFSNTRSLEDIQDLEHRWIALLRLIISNDNLLRQDFPLKQNMTHECYHSPSVREKFYPVCHVVWRVNVLCTLRALMQLQH